MPLTRLKSPDAAARWLSSWVTGALLLFAQPIRVLADRGAPPGFELLVRLRDENGELRSPNEFIEAAKRLVSGCSK